MKNETRETAPGRTFRVVITETLKRVVEVNESEIKEPTMDEAVQAVSEIGRAHV